MSRDPNTTELDPEANGEMSEDQDGGLRLRMRGEERRINSQHEQLDCLCREVYTKLDKDGPALAINDYLLFMTALDAHMTVEEDIYFPALHGLRTDAAEELTGLVDEHADIRRESDEVRLLLKSGDRDGARLALDGLARHISRHEEAEEDLLARITEGPVERSGHSGFEG
jgi:hypothetical protein